MEKLYYENQYLKEFVAEVVDVREKEGKFYVVLDKTAFFPGGGGQKQDKGFIDNNEVIDVCEEKGIVYHVLEKKPLKIHKVKCKIDWPNRLDGMQHHSAQHVLSGCFFTLFNANTAAVHVGKEIATVDIKGVLSEEQIRKAEIYANEIIEDNMPITMFAPTKSELKKIKIRRDLPNTDEEIRIVQIGDLDINACCGVHLSSTLHIGTIKIIKWEKHKGNTRIEYLAGKRAFNHYLKEQDFSNKICSFLSCGEEDAIKTINNLENEVKELKGENRELKNNLGDYEIKEMLENAEKINNTSIIRKIYNTADVKHLSKLAEKLCETENVIALFAAINGEKVNLVFTSWKGNKVISMSDLLKDSITLIDGKGGGSKIQAQGGGKNNNNLQSVLDYAFMKIKNIVVEM